MAIYVADPDVAEELLAQRQRSGGDRYDEVWDGVYVMAPLANNEHQLLASDLGATFKVALGWKPEFQVYVGVNVSDRDSDWRTNYRCPDVAVVLPGNPARNCGTHWYGGPDFLAEIISPGDRSREKFAFYTKIGVRELLLIDRDPWQLELYRGRGRTLRRVGRSTPQKAAVLTSKVLPLSFQLLAGTPRPQLAVSHADGVQAWRV